MKKWTLIALSSILVAMVSCRKEELPIETVEYLSEEQAKDLPRTGLPIVIIKAPNLDSIGDVTKEWSTGNSIIIVNPDLSVNLRTTTSIKGRGNASWLYYIKKSYNLKFDQKAKVLGMHSNRRWCLLSNGLDRTSIRNALSFEIARRSPALDWTSEGQFVEVVFNGKHLGNYYLCEKIRVGKHRVDIATPAPSTTSGDALTGGYLMEIDEYYDEPQKFHSSVKKLPWMFKNDDEVNDAQFQYMNDYVNTMEQALYDKNQFKARRFAEYLDLESFADYWIVNELAMNRELEHPKSCYMHKDVGGPIKAGPVWDFDWDTYTRYKVNTFTNIDTFYFRRLFEDAQFKTLVKKKWNAQKNDYLSLTDYIDQLHDQLAASDRIDSVITNRQHNVNQDDFLSFDESYARMKAVLKVRINWLDRQINKW